MSRAKATRLRRPSRGRRPAERRGRGRGSPLWLAVILAVAGLAGGAVYFAEHLKAGAYDSATLCPEAGPKATLAILLDLTDPVTRPQAQRLRMILGREIAQAPTGTMISVGLVSADKANWGAAFSRCKPQEGADANPLIQNPRLVGELYNDEFIVPFDKVLSDLLHLPKADSSPIMESLQALVSETPSIETETIPRKLVLATDLLQNSETLSFYRGQFWTAFAEMGGPARLSGNLQGVDVMILRVPREGKLTGEAAVDDFWLHYFDIQGANGGFDVRVLGDL